MAKTVQNIVDAATAQSLSLDGDLLVQDTAEILGKLNDLTNELFAELAAWVKWYYGAKTQITSSTGSSGRTADLTKGATITVFRLREITLNATGGLVFKVDEEAQGAQPSPRAFQRGETLHEVGSEWSSTTGTVNLDVVYTRGPIQLDESGAYTQTVDLPERWTHPLEHRLTAYLLRKDDQAQAATVWDKEAEGALKELVTYLTGLHGEGERE